MTPPTTAPTPAILTPRPGSRAARFRLPLARHVVEQVAIDNGVCIRPLAMQKINVVTGETETIPMPCGATLASKCPPCAERARRLRITQCREGWHLDDEPLPESDPPTDTAKQLIVRRADLEAARAAVEHATDGTELVRADADIAQVDDDLTSEGVRGRAAPDNRDRARRTRSTRRRQDTPDLPRLPVDKRTVGRTYTAADGTAWRPSMFLTLTCGSYGRVRSDGTPIDPDSYDYRRAARDAIHFPKLVDRFWQNLRRAAGYDIQYFAALEPQRRLAPHLHAAMRGTIPRKLVRQVAAATYVQVWWPDHDSPVYGPDRPPVWDDDHAGYVDPDTGAVLPTWDEALDAIGPDAEPAHVARFGVQLRADGVVANSATAGKLIGYLTKYLTKSLDTCHTTDTDAQRRHVERLAAALRHEPCSPVCANWLLYGTQPKNARPGLRPGRCNGKAHKRETLGFGGRRVLTSRRWSGKTLTDHRRDRLDYIRAQLAALGHADPTADAGHTVWQLHGPGDPTAPRREHLILHAIADRERWRAQFDLANVGDPPGADSAIQPHRGRAA